MPSANYLEAQKRIADAKAEAQRIAEEAFNEEATQLVKDLGYESFSWHQYTPYFNDGDACVFRVNSDYPLINGIDEYGYREDDDEGEVEDRSLGLPPMPDYTLRQENPEEYERQRALAEAPFNRVREFLRQWSEEDMLFMFGDHAQITVTADGVEVNDYEHD
jgi:hypothetical protein